MRRVFSPGNMTRIWLRKDQEDMLFLERSIDCRLVGNSKSTVG